MARFCQRAAQQTANTFPVGKLNSDSNPCFEKYEFGQRNRTATQQIMGWGIRSVVSSTTKQTKVAQNEMCREVPILFFVFYFRNIYNALQMVIFFFYKKISKTNFMGWANFFHCETIMRKNMGQIVEGKRILLYRRYRQEMLKSPSNSRNWSEITTLAVGYRANEEYALG